MAKIKSLADQAYDRIVEKIKLGELAEGEKIDEAALIEEIGISRTPIRESLLLLTSDRVLESIPRKGFFVKGHDQQEMRNAYSVIACLETFAIRQVMPLLKDYDYAKMGHLVELMDIAIKLKDYSRYVENQEMFHAYCIDKTGNQALIDAINSIKKQFPRQSYFSPDSQELFEMLRKSNEGHQNILKAIQDQDLTEVEKQCFTHWCWNYRATA